MKTNFTMLLPAYFVLQMKGYRMSGTQKLQRFQNASQRKTTNEVMKLETKLTETFK